MPKPFPDLDQLPDDETIKPTETYVLEDDELATLEDAGLTGIMEGLTERMDETEVPYDYEPNVDDYAWVSETNAAVALDEGYDHYRSQDRACYRRTPMGEREFLLKKPRP